MSEPAAAHRSRVVAVFDLDGTLVSRGSMGRFVRHLAGTGGALAAVVSGLRRGAVPPSRLWFKEGALARVLAGRAIEDVRERGRAFAETVLVPDLRPDMVAMVDDHRRQGHHLVLLTSGLDVYARPLGERLGFHDVISTTVVAGDETGRCTGELHDADLTGLGKVTALARLLDERGWPREGLRVDAYGNSRDDRPLLAWARHVGTD